MQVRTPLTSLPFTAGAHEQKPVSCRATTTSTHISGRARMATLSGVGVGVGTVSTTAKPFFNGDSLGRSQAKDLEGHAGGRHSPGCRLR